MQVLDHKGRAGGLKAVAQPTSAVEAKAPAGQVRLVT